MWPAPLPQAFEKVNFTALGCPCITLREFIFCTGLCRGHTGRFFVCILFQGFCSLVLPFALRRLGRLVAFNRLIFCFGDSPHPACRKFTWQFLYARRAWQSSWVPGLLNQTPGWSVLSVTPLGVKIPLSWVYHCRVGAVWPQREGTSRGTPLSCWPGRWIIWSLCHGACTTPFGGISSVSKAPSTERNKQ